jgi:hypothetical protein
MGDICGPVGVLAFWFSLSSAPDPSPEKSMLKGIGVQPCFDLSENSVAYTR